MKYFIKKLDKPHKIFENDHGEMLHLSGLFFHKLTFGKAIRILSNLETYGMAEIDLSKMEELGLRNKVFEKFETDPVFYLEAKYDCQNIEESLEI